MEEEPTQPATQLVIDPRRLGQHNSGLNDEDLADIFCILHPASMPAYQAIAQIAEDTPEHTISNSSVPLKIRGENGPKVSEPGTFDLAAQGLVSRDIALRLSADLKDPLSGFRFGRNAQRCDFVIGNTEGARRISNVHFRIYINDFGIIMLEDQSTNGTLVEGAMLRAKDKENGAMYRHTLVQGSLITLMMTPPEEDIKFVVRIPQREEEYEETFRQNLQRYLSRLGYLKQLRENEKAGITNNTSAAVKYTGRKPEDMPKPLEAPDVFAQKQENGTTPVTDSDVSRRIKEWRGGAMYNRVGTIGKGAFATVYMITAKFDGTVYAAKELEKRRFMKNGIMDQKVDMEMRIMRKIKHPNIVQYIEHVDWEEKLYLIMEYVPCGDLGGLISANRKLSEPIVKAMSSQLLSALKYLHTEGITHRDVKPDNILIQSKDPFIVKLTDFGLSKMVNDDETFLQTFCGTLLYCAPEVYSEYREYDTNGHRNLRGRDRKSLPPQRYGHAVDLWSLGSVIYYALCGSPPYPAKNGTTYQELLNMIMTTPLDVRPLQNAEVSDDGIRFIKAMLQIRPENRATIDELQTSPWVSGSYPSSFDDYDEVDMIGQSGFDDDLEQSASQLNINENKENIMQEINDSEGDDIDLVKQVYIGPEAEIPNSFRTGDSTSDGSLAFIRNNGNGPRLFGEVNPSILASSGVIPEDHLNLPVSDSDRFDPQSEQDPSRPQTAVSAQADQAESLVDPHLQQQIPQSPDVGAGGTAPSLLGAESMVGMLQMNSPPSAPHDTPSPQTGALHGPPTPDFRESMRILRRPRESDDESRPEAKRAKSSRAIDMEVSQQVFWDAKNKSTWHFEYPKMRLSEWEEAKAIAREHGEEFSHGNKVFDAIVNSNRRASSSSETSVPARAQSDPVVEIGRRQLMKRDDRKLSDGDEDAILPQTTRSEFFPVIGAEDHLTTEAIASTTLPNTAPVDEHFLLPRRPLAKLSPTADSVFPNLSISITAELTSWGRGGLNSVVYPDNREGRIPKYVFKLFLYSPGSEAHNLADTISHAHVPGSPTNGGGKASDDYTQSRFYISTKATRGIHINDIHLSSRDPQSVWTESRFWGELHHGDIITVWEEKGKAARFRFDCLIDSPSQTSRPEGAPFHLVEEESLINEIEFACLKADDERRRKEKKDTRREQWEVLADTIQPQ